MKEITIDNFSEISLTENYDQQKERNFGACNLFLSGNSGNEKRKLYPFMYSLFDKFKRKIIWMDSGAGIGKLIYTFQENKIRRRVLGEVIGITQHHFQETYDILKELEDFISWYIATPEEMVESHSGKIDVITDVYGPFQYSKDRISVLKSYYKLLHPEGEAFILLYDDREYEHNYCAKDDVLVDGKAKRLEEYLSEIFPGVFFWEDRLLLMEKNTNSFPDINLNQIDFKRDVDEIKPQIQRLFEESCPEETVINLNKQDPIPYCRYLVLGQQII